MLCVFLNLNTHPHTPPLLSPSVWHSMSDICVFLSGKVKASKTASSSLSQLRLWVSGTITGASPLALVNLRACQYFLYMGTFM